MTLKKISILLLIFLSINFALNLYGINWGLPSRWHSDERVTDVLHMAERRSLVDVDNEFFEQTGYQLLLLIWFIPLFALLKLFHYPFDQLKEAASVSWHHMASLFPSFATNIYIYARILSAVTGVITVYLIYLLGKEIYNKKIGLFSAAFLSVCMGFVGINHLAKYASFLNLLIVLTLFFSVKGSFCLAFFFAGLTFSVHSNGLLLLLPLLLAIIFNSVNLRRAAFVFTKSIPLYLGGILLGTPSLITNFGEYFLKFKILFKSFFSVKQINYVHPVSEILDSLFTGPINYFFEIWSVTGILIFALILIGIAVTINRWRGISKKEVIIYSFIILNYFTVAVLFESNLPSQKFIIGIVPLLFLFAGRAMFEIFEEKKISIYFRQAIFFLIFIYSFAYTFKGDLVFAREDTRYESTNWVLKNVPKGSKIELFDQIHYVCSDEIMNYYEIIYLGRSTADFKGERFFKWNKVEGRDEYFQFINRHDSSSDYIIIDIDDINKIYSPNYMSHIPGLAKYLKDLFGHKKNFKLIKVFQSKNQPIASKKIKGVVYPSSLWWDPIPVSREVSPTIYVFKNMDSNAASYDGLRYAKDIYQ